MIVAKYLAEYLRNIGITHVFGYDGSMMLKIADEISLTEGIRFYQGFHEQASSFAADAYARVTSDLGVVLVTSGPGAINAMSGCADAFLDSIPLLIITGQDRLTHIEGNPGVRLNGFQDLDIVRVSTPITKYAVQLKDASQVAYELEKCIYMAKEGRRGPVVFDVPMDVQFWEVPEEIPHFIPENNQAETLDNRTCDSVLDAIYSAKRPVILAGGGIRIADAREELVQFADKTGIPVVSTLNGHDAYNKSVGTSGLYGHAEANLAIYQADLLIALGARFGQRQVGKPISEYTNASIIHVDIDDKEFGRVLEPEIALRADVKSFLTYVNKNIDTSLLHDYKQWLEQIAEWKNQYKDDLNVNHGCIDPIKLVRYIGDESPEDAIFTNDVGQNTMWVSQGLNPKGNQRLLTSSGYASMGFSLPAAIGAKMARSESLVVSFSGDGGFHMNLQELQFVDLYKLDIKFVVFNNNTLGMMREVQRIYYNENYVGSNTDEFVCANLAKLADLYHLEYLMVDSENDFFKVGEALNNGRATIIDCRLPIDTYLKNWTDFKNEHPEVLEPIG